MNYKKIEETIKSKNFALKFFIPKVTGMTVQGFRKAILNETIKLRDVEKISEALGLPMKYWWEENQDDFIMKEGNNDNRIGEKERRMYQNVITNLNKIIHDYEEQLGKKETRKRATG